jgi:peptidoglycan/xylan/chitin deacetylase (PgdA/CDA1 family)
METQAQVSLTRILKFSISLLVFAATKVRNGVLRTMGNQLNATYVILYYHSVPAQQRANFANQLDVLLNTTKVIALDRKIDRLGGGPHVAITFDDAFLNFFEEALPELERRKLPCTMFAIADGLGKAFGQENSPELIMTLEQLRALPEGLVIIGSHTLTHPMLTKVSRETALHEIVESRKKMQVMLNRPVHYFSFPFGDFNEGLVPLCREAGYSRVFTTLPVFAFEDSNEFVTGRVRVDPTDWPLEFRLKVAGAYRWLPWAFRIKRMIVSNSLFRTIQKRRRGKSLRPSHSQSMIHP